jgi:tRNA/rRNA methyltransferase
MPALAPPMAATQANLGPAPTAPLEQVEMFYGDLEVLLLKIGYLYPHTAPSRMAKLRRLLHRAEPDSQELAMLRGIVRQLNWAVESLPQDSPIRESRDG